MNSDNRDNGNKEWRFESWLENDRIPDASENMQSDVLSEMPPDDTPIMSPLYMYPAFQCEYGV